MSFQSPHFTTLTAAHADVQLYSNCWCLQESCCSHWLWLPKQIFWCDWLNVQTKENHFLRSSAQNKQTAEVKVAAGNLWKPPLISQFNNNKNVKKKTTTTKTQWCMLLSITVLVKFRRCLFVLQFSTRAVWQHRGRVRRKRVWESKGCNSHTAPWRGDKSQGCNLALARLAKHRHHK